MALQLGALRDALIKAGVGDEIAVKASEEVAGYENRLTRLTTMVQVMLGIGVLLLGSQAALWNEVGKLVGTVGQMNATLIALSTKVDALDGKITTKVDALDGKITAMDGKIDQIARSLSAPH